MATVMGPDRTKEEALIRLVNDNQTSLLKLCFAYLHDVALAEDAVQEKFLKAYKSLELYKGKASEKTWLSSIAINCCRDMRRSSWFKHVDSSVSLETLPEASEPAADYDNALALEIMRLPKRLKEVILLYYFRELSAIETAAVLGISQSAVSNRLKRAKARLKKALGAQYERGEQNE